MQWAVIDPCDNAIQNPNATEAQRAAHTPWVVNVRMPIMTPGGKKRVSYAYATRPLKSARTSGPQRAQIACTLRLTYCLSQPCDRPLGKGGHSPGLRTHSNNQGRNPGLPLTHGMNTVDLASLTHMLLGQYHYRERKHRKGSQQCRKHRYHLRRRNALLTYTPRKARLLHRAIRNNTELADGLRSDKPYIAVWSWGRAGAGQGAQGGGRATGPPNQPNHSNTRDSQADRHGSSEGR